MSATLLKLGVITTDYLVKKSGLLGNREERAEYIEHMRGSDVYYLYNKYIEKISSEEFFKLYFNNTISHISDRNIKQLTLAKRISPTDSKEYLAEMYSLVSKLMSESTVVESAGSSKCMRHPKPDEFLFILEDTPENVSLFIQTEDLQNYLATQDASPLPSNYIAGRPTRRFSYTATALEDLSDVITQMESDLGCDYNAYVKLQSVIEENDSSTTYMFSVDGPEAEELYSDLTAYPAWKCHTNIVKSALKGTAKIAAKGLRGATADIAEPIETVASHYRNQSDKTEAFDTFKYMYRDTADLSLILLPGDITYERQGKMLDSSLDELNHHIQNNPEPEAIDQYLRSKGFQMRQVQPEEPVEDPNADNPDIHVFSKRFSHWNKEKSKPSKLGSNSNREELWNNYVDVLMGMSDKEFNQIIKTVQGKKTKKQSDIELL